MTVGTLVAPVKEEWGIGVIVAVQDDIAFVYFKNQKENAAKKFRFATLKVSDVESDDELQNLIVTPGKETGYTVKSATASPRARKKAKPASA